MPVFTVIRRGVYHDSVTLMRVSREMEATPGVRRAAAMMGTPANRTLLREAGLLGDDADRASPTDLLLTAVADDDAAAHAAWQAADAALTRPPGAGSGPGAALRPRTLRAAHERWPDATLVLVSVPGLYAAAEARQALRRGLDVMLFSDHVAVEDEVALKRLARERDLLMMGPDCGTAILGGVPLGFANAIPRGRIGIAAASGTGLQAVSCHIAAAGEGVSHAIGLGGRDLGDDVGGLMLERALEALARDPATEIVCVVGKRPGPVTAAKIEGWLDDLAKPWVAYFTEASSARRGASAASTPPIASLEDAALAAVALARGTPYRPAAFTAEAQDIERIVHEAAASLAPGRRFVRGLYAGGTLAQEARALLAAALGEVAWGARGHAHRVLDLGDDAYTVGRPHPMIDGGLRREWIAREAADPATAVVLLDVVLGYGAHADPAGELAAGIGGARARGVVVIASVCGAERDPQGLASQADVLRRAGAIVMPSNAQAARLAARIASLRG